ARKRGGIFNVHSLPTPFRVFLDESSSGIDGKAKVVWVDADFLRQAQHVHTFGNMPYWNPDRPGFEQISSAKARATGWTGRRLVETAKDAWASYQKTVAP